ncbi:MAG: phytanoyl-CoA dioxygenase family protein [Gammaproteobacteria bacterium]
MEQSTVHNPLPGIPLVESPLFEKLLSGLPEHVRDIAVQLHTNGYAVIDFPDDDFDNRAERIKQYLQREVFDGGDAPSRIHDAWKHDDDIRAIAANASIVDLLSMLYGRRAIPFQTLNFRCGSEQPYHSDAVHFSSNPERYMCGVWVALEDVTEANGPLIYYPQSHKLPILSNEDIGYSVLKDAQSPTQVIYHNAWETLVHEAELQPKTFLAKKGQTLIWTANLLHGGMRISDRNATRWSQVTHYFFDNCSYYTPMHSNVFLGTIRYRKIVDITTGEAVPNMCCGEPVPERVLKHLLGSDYGSRRIYGLKFVRRHLTALHKMLTGR